MTHPFLRIEESSTIDHDAFLHEALRWHFSERTGSRLWLDRAATLGFDPLRDIRSYADLARFPDVSADLRERPVEDLIPRGLAGEPPPSVFETGGTTGSPKRLVYTERWTRRALSWKVEELTAAGFPVGEAWLVAMPSGPHAFGNTTRLQARALGSLLHTVDLDPRWVKKALAAGADASGYVAHVLDQIGHIVRTQPIAAVTTTPPLFAELLLRDDLVDRLRQSVRYLAFAGAHLDDDTRDLIAEAFPDAVIQNIYGSTMVLTTARLRPAERVDAVDVYDGYAPFVTFGVVDPDSGAPVELGARGQVRMSHISSGAFLPNTLERDSAIRVAARAGGAGDALGAPEPLAVFDGEPVIQGVY